jgi:hypothetical protein
MEHRVQDGHFSKKNKLVLMQRRKNPAFHPSKMRLVVQRAKIWTYFFTNSLHMNFLKSFSIYLLASAVLFITACKKDALAPSDALAYVPATASNVTAIDLKSLLQKADFEAIKQMSFYKDMIAETESRDPKLAKILLDPTSSGIDLSGKIYTATDIGQDNAEAFTTYFFIPLKDAKAFGSLFEEHKTSITVENGISLFDEGKDAIFGWNESVAVLAIGNKQDSDFKGRVIAAFQPKTDNPLLKDGNLQKALSGNHDITSWLSTNELAKNSGAVFALSMMDVKSDALKGNFIHSYADFEKGKLVGRSEFMFNDQMGKDFIGRFFKHEAKTDFSKVLPQQKLTFATVMALDLVGMDKFLSERPQNKDYADFVLNKIGIKRRDLVEALGGDVMVAGYGGSTLNDANIQVSMSLRDEAKALELLEIAVKDGKLKMVEPNVYKLISIGNEDFYIQRNKGMGKLLLKNGILTFVTDEALFEKLKAGETGGEYSTALKQFDHQTFAGWFDFQSAWNALGGDQTQSFKQMNFKMNGKGADFILETADPNSNSLKALFEMMDEGYKQRGKLPEESL